MRLKRQGQKTGIGLNFAISLAVFCIQFITILMSAVFTYLLIQLGVISSGGDSELSMGHIILFMVVISNAIGSMVAFVAIRIPLKLARVPGLMLISSATPILCAERAMGSSIPRIISP